MRVSWGVSLARSKGFAQYDECEAQRICVPFKLKRLDVETKCRADRVNVLAVKLFPVGR